MIVVPGRGARRLLRAVTAGIVAGIVAGIMLAAVGPVSAAYPDPGPTGIDPTPTPTDVPPTTDPPPPPAVRIDASDLALGPWYWQGPGAHGTVVVKVTNTSVPGAPSESVTLTYTLPPGVHDIGLGCPCTNTLAPNDVWTVNLDLSVDPDAWRRAPLTGTVAAVATSPSGLTARDQHGYSVILPPGPPTPGVSLIASDLLLPAVPPRRMETAPLNVRLANTGTVPVTTAIELITPDGVAISSFPGACQSHRRIAAHRERCELGRVDSGTDRSLAFTLSISPLARGEAPLSGAVHGYLTPSGQDTVEVQTGYRIVVPPVPGQPASATPSGAPASESATPVGGDGAGEQGGTVAAGGPANEGPNNRGIPLAPVAGLLVGLFAVIGLFVVLSLRRRMQGEPAMARTTVRRPAAGTARATGSDATRTLWPPPVNAAPTWPPMDDLAEDDDQDDCLADDLDDDEPAEGEGAASDEVRTS
jgi:hypothetical protein